MGQIQLTDLTKRFGDTVAVDDLSLDIADEEFLVLVGPSGCGKSTTLRMLAGLETPTSGDIYIGGDHMNYRVPQNRDIAMVFQDYALYPHMTVRQNIRFGLEEEEGYTSEERDERVVEVAETLGISDLLDRKPDELSGGQQQRVALGRAIVRDPEVFLMDEPLSNLDAKLRAEMRTELQNLQDQLAVTTVYVTHNQTEAMTMADRIAVMDDGELQQVASPFECYHEPNNLFVAEFIGEPMINLVRGTRSETTFVGEHFSYPLDADVMESVGDREDLVLGIRPEDIEVVDATTDDTAADAALGDHELRMDVTVVEPHGDQNVLHLSHPDQPSADDALQAVTEGMHLVTRGDRVTVTIPPDKIHVFDAETGTAVHNRRHDQEADRTQLEQ
ncbi:xylose/arabinose ABC transporter ATP-binding protein XacJ [Haloferax sulfurifontis]|uniref:ABC-type D-xylose/L-arabinose transporter n=2 Tax=Haloferax sulfurifontis TaxID=255616 RepID=M0IJP5_9EURY|nr:xylose/arabinose ABC transporter ATP-binding protein XacJ [Haloferax sulfurifontis]ELZ96277.1 sugar ABC transporter ATP-binding protein [Haloferax sulfurifontis ATCC BAA-897]GGC65262.1 ABC transporter ATP-binding protein [Haloferax sulfurifontis]